MSPTKDLIKPSTSRFQKPVKKSFGGSLAKLLETANKGKVSTKMSKRFVYSYGAGKAEARGDELTKNVLGGKGIGLMEMTSIGIPVPAGFTVTIQTCEEYYKLGRKLPKGLEQEVREAVLKLEKSPAKN